MSQMTRSSQTVRLPRATFSQLRTFEAVARLGGVTRAAESLHLAQPTVSVQLRELTALVGAELVAPAGRGIQLTEAGRALLEAVRAISTEWQTFEDTVQSLAGLHKGVLRVAGVTTAEYFIAQVLKPFHALYPGIDIDLAIENRDAVVRRLEHDLDDIAVMMLPPAHLAVDSYAFLDNPLVLISPVGHAWAASRRMPLRRLDGCPLLMREPGSGTRQTALEWLAQRGVTPKIQMTLGSNEALKHAVAAGLGLAIISSHTLREDPASEGLAVVGVAGLPIRQQWKLVWRSDRRLPLVSRAFLDFVKSRGAAPASALREPRPPSRSRS